MAEKERADVALVKRGLCESREKAQANIMAGLVYIGQRKVLKASDPVKPEDELILRGKANPFVGQNSALCQPGWTEAGESHCRL